MSTPSITTRVVRNLRRRGVKVMTRNQWGTVHSDLYDERRRDTREGRWGRFVEPADTVVQHITVTFDDGVLTGEFAADCREVERIGFERFGSGVSYNFLVDMKTGMVGVGQPLDSKGTHTVNDKKRAGFSYDQNLAARAIAVLGMPDDELSPKAQASLASVLAAMVDEGAITAGFDYLPHSFFAEKDCCCDATRSRMGGIRENARRAVTP